MSMYERDIDEYVWERYRWVCMRNRNGMYEREDKRYVWERYRMAGYERDIDGMYERDIDEYERGEIERWYVWERYRCYV